MSRISSFFMGVLVGAVGLYISMHYYVVRSKENIHLVPKVAAKLEIPYFDIRQYTADDWKAQPSLGLAIVKSQNENLISDSSIGAVKSHFEGFLKQLASGL
jgi:hypothetical protein